MVDEFFPLTRIADILGGYAFKSEDFGTTGFPVVKIASIEPPRVNLDSGEKILPEKVLNLDRFRLKDRDIVMAMTGATIGKVGRVRSSLPAYLNQRVAKLSAKAGPEFDDFIYAFVSQVGFDEQILSNSHGSAQANISTEAIGRILVPNIAPSAQIQIGRTIAAFDDKIELNRRMNETLEALAQTLFKSWFIDPTRNGLPKGWREATLGEVAENPRRGIDADEIKSNTAYIGLEHMPRCCIALSNWGSTEGLESNKFQFKRGEILFGKLRPYFHKVGVAPLDGVCSTDILVVTAKEPEWFGFVLGHVSSVELVEHTNAASTGTKMPRTNWKDISRFEVALPPKEIAAEFTEKIRPIVERIISNIHESRTLASLRDALLPKLLSGELRVPTLNL
jgi:type I restriction enzyme S subunit